jgi:hypothetical protein
MRRHPRPRTESSQAFRTRDPSTTYFEEATVLKTIIRATALLFLLAFANVCTAQTTAFTANLAQIAGGDVSGYRLGLSVQNCANYLLRLPGPGVSVGDTVYLSADGTALVSTTVPDQVFIGCGSTTANTFYRVSVVEWNDTTNRPILPAKRYNDYDITGAAFNLNIATPRTAPAPAAVANALLLNASGDQTVVIPAGKKVNFSGGTVDLSGTTCIGCGTGGPGGGITSLNTLTGTTQTFANDANVTIVSSGTTHTLTWVGALAKARMHAATAFTDQANTFLAGMKQTVQASATTAGFAFNGVTADPSSLASGDHWYRSDTNHLRFRDSAAATHTLFNSDDSLPGAQVSGNISGNAATATALAANPADCGANQFANAIAGNGDLACQQPAFSNLSGSLAAGQMPALTGDVTSSAGSTATTLPNIVAASTQTKITYNAKGQVTAGAQAQFSDVGGALAIGQIPTGTSSSTVAIGNDSRITGAEQTANKDAASGYAGLTAGSLLKAAEFPALTGDVTSSAGSTATTLPNIVSASTQTKVTYNAKGQVTAGAQAQFSDVGGSVAASQMPALTGAVTSPAGSTATSAGVRDAVDASGFCPDAGSTDTYACNLSPVIGSYVTGTHYRFKANTANTGPASINFNSLGAKTIKKAAGGVTTDLADNDIRVGQWVDLVYDGTNMQMQSTSGNASAGGSGTTIQVAGTGLAGTTANFNATPTPAVPITSVGAPVVTFQADASSPTNISAFVPAIPRDVSRLAAFLPTNMAGGYIGSGDNVFTSQNGTGNSIGSVSAPTTSSVGATSNSAAGTAGNWVSTKGSDAMLKVGQHIIFDSYQKLSNTTTQVRLWAGLFDQNGFTINVDSPAATNIVAFRYSSTTDSFISCVTDNASGTPNVVASSVASPTVWARYTIIEDTANSKWHFYITSAGIGALTEVCGTGISTKNPAAGTLLHFEVMAMAKSTTAVTQLYRSVYWQEDAW